MEQTIKDSLRPVLRECRGSIRGILGGRGAREEKTRKGQWQGSLKSRMFHKEWKSGCSTYSDAISRSKKMPK